MSILLFQVISIVADLFIFISVGYYFFKLRQREKELAKKEKELELKTGKIDTEYHQIVDTALTKERKIIEDATTEAGQIISDAEHIGNASTNSVNDALQKMIVDIQKEAIDTSRNYMEGYSVSLKQLSLQSLTEFQTVTKSLHQDMQQQIKQFRESLLSTVEKEIADYKKSRLEQTEKTISTIIQKVSQEVLNKSISHADHESLLIDSLEKAKKEGIFN